MNKEVNLAKDIAEGYGIPNKMVKKATQAIEIIEKKPLSLFSRRLYNHLLAIAYKDLDNERVEVYKVPLNTFRLGKNNNSVVKKCLEELQSTLVQYNYLNRNKDNVWTSTHLLGTVSISDGILEYAFPKEVRELLHEPAQYAQISLSVIYAFRSKYSLVLYEIISARWRLKYIKKEEFSIDDIRILMTVPKGKLSAFKDFRKYCLEPAIREVNHFSPFNVKIDANNYKKTGKKISYITIEWEKKDPQELDETIEVIDNELPLFALRTQKLKLTEDTEENRKALDHYLRFGKGRRKQYLELAMNTEKTFSGHILKQKEKPEVWIHFIAKKIKKDLAAEF